MVYQQDVKRKLEGSWAYHGVGEGRVRVLTTCHPEDLLGQSSTYRQCLSFPKEMLAKSFRNRQSVIILYSCSRTPHSRLFHYSRLNRNDNQDLPNNEKESDVVKVSDREWEIRSGI
jgi:hypothetical protein